MKRSLALLYGIVVLLALLVSCESAAPASDFTYSENENGGITIEKYNGSAERVVIPKAIDKKKVTLIGEKAFAESDVASVVIPDTVEHINDWAFCNCEKLSEIKMSKSLVTIGIGTFYECKSLTEIDISMSTMKYIASISFMNCENLDSVEFGDNIKRIDESAFKGCTALREVILPENLEMLGDAAFMGCSALEKISFSANMDLFFVSAPAPFSATPSLKEVVFENGREEIAGYACIQTAVGSHVKITIPESVKRFSTSPFLLNGSAEIEFLGDCPEIIETPEFFYIEHYNTELTIYYDPDTEGWDTCPWKDMYTLVPKS